LICRHFLFRGADDHRRLFGNGSYSLKGWNIFFTADNNRSETKKGWYRLEEESKDEGNTWAGKLYILRISDVNWGGI
jgi:hypothetical protein